MNIIPTTVDRAFRTALVILLVLSVLVRSSWAQASDGAIRGTVSDPLGGRVAGANVTLVREGQRGATAVTNPQGEYAFDGVVDGRYQLEVEAGGFRTRLTASFYVSSTSRLSVDVTLQIGPLTQEVVVSAAASELPQSQVGAAIAVVDHALLEISSKLDVFDAIRVVPGVQVVQTGARGGTTSVFVRGGHPGFTKVLVDGVPMNDIGGAFNFADLETTGVDRVEVLRGSNSVLYGTDALSGVLNVTTTRGRSTRPEVSFSTDGGSFGTAHQAASIGGAFKRVDYFSAYSHLDTDNDVPNNGFQNDTFAGRVGVAIAGNTDLSVTARQNVSDLGVPNAVAYYGLSDDSSQHTRFTTVGATVRSQIAQRLMTTVQVASSDQTLRLTNPTPTGEPFDPFGFGPNYLGELVTIRGANGTTATGQALLDYGGTYPSLYSATSTRRSVYGQADYQARPSLNVAGGFRFDHEHGVTDSGTPASTTRNTVGAFVEARAVVGRVYMNAGLGFDHNTVFQSAVVPRISVAAYLRPPSVAGAWGETKLTFNAGQGMKAPTVAQELSSLFALVEANPGVATSVTPIGPERSTGVDVGVEQVAAGGHLRLRASFFDNRFEDLIEFVSNTALPQLGIPQEVANATDFGAYVNSSSYTARGLEASMEAAIGPGLRVLGSYMYLATDVTASFASSALEPSINPSYPDTPIGAYSPLVGGRAFRRPPHSGTLTLAYAAGRAQAFLSGYFSGQFDESTFLSDAYFGSSMLLPNHDLGAGYQKLDVNLAYAFAPQVRAFVTVENLTGADYQASSGFPALPRAIRAGLKLMFGGDR